MMILEKEKGKENKNQKLKETVSRFVLRVPYDVDLFDITTADYPVSPEIEDKSRRVYKGLTGFVQNVIDIAPADMITDIDSVLEVFRSRLDSEDNSFETAGALLASRTYEEFTRMYKEVEVDKLTSSGGLIYVMHKKRSLPNLVGLQLQKDLQTSAFSHLVGEELSNVSNLDTVTIPENPEINFDEFNTRVHKILKV